MFNKFHSAREKGFTLVELLVVIGIIGILAMLLLPQFRGMRDRARAASCQSNLKNCGTQHEVYYTDHDNYPTDGTYLATFGKLQQCPVQSDPYTYTASQLVTTTAAGLKDTWAAQANGVYVISCDQHNGNDPGVDAAHDKYPGGIQIYVSPEGTVRKSVYGGGGAGSP